MTTKTRVRGAVFIGIFCRCLRLRGVYNAIAQDPDARGIFWRAPSGRWGAGGLSRTRIPVQAIQKDPVPSSPPPVSPPLTTGRPLMVRGQGAPLPPEGKGSRKGQG